MTLPPDIEARAIELSAAGGKLIGKTVEGVEAVYLLDEFVKLLTTLQERHETRVTELLEANNREVEARRVARADANRMINILLQLGWEPTMPPAPVADLPVRSIPMSTLPGITPISGPFLAGPEPIRPREAT